LARAYFSEGRYAEAESLYLRAIAIQEKSLGRVHPDVAVTLFNYADVLRQEHREAEVRRVTNRARAIDAQSLTERSAQQTVTYQDLQQR